MAPEIKAITEPVLIGEGPHWDERQQALFFVSILENTIHKYVLATGAHTRTKLDGRVGFIVPVEGKTDQFLVGLQTKFVVIQWDGAEGSPVKVVREIGVVGQDTVPENRLNDGKADPMGRVYAGTICYEDIPGNIKIIPNKGSLYRVDKGVHKLASGIGFSNGLAWDLKRKAFYYTDSMENKIRKYDYDPESGTISNMRYVITLEKNEHFGGPDGTTIDADGNLWVAIGGGSCILKIDPVKGQVLEKIQMPVSHVTSVTFGGPNYDILFVTTGKEAGNSVQKSLCGSTFMITGLGVKGLPNNNFKF